MFVQKALLGPSQYIYLVLDENFLPIKPIQEFIRYLSNLERSPNTIRAYANHLKLYWEYLASIHKSWDAVKLDDLAGFLSWLRLQNTDVIALRGQEAKRTETTVNAILSAITMFYNFHQQLGNTTVTLTTTSTAPARRYKPLLHHISKNKPVKSRLIKLKIPHKTPKTLTQNQIKELIKNCLSLRDQFLISLLYETGMRIGQALGLRHEDIKSWDNEIHIIPRNHNENEARAKTHSSNIIHVSQKLITLYTRYLLEECEHCENDFVFIHTQGKTPNKPLTYRAVKSLFRRLSAKLGIKATPHMLRHTHATELITHGWDCSYVQRRLGHASVQTTLNTYSHLSNDDLRQAFNNYQKNW